MILSVQYAAVFTTLGQLFGSLPDDYDVLNIEFVVR